MMPFSSLFTHEAQELIPQISQLHNLKADESHFYSKLFQTLKKL